jgi:hypothetical protein
MKGLCVMVPTLHSLCHLLRRSVRAFDCDFGSLCNVYINETDWKVGYFVVQTGGWLHDRSVLISPVTLRTPFWQEEDFVHVDLTRQEILDLPSIDAAKPVSRRQEELMNAYFGWPAYWNCKPADPLLPTAGMIETGGGELRSLRELTVYSAVGKDDCELGRISDFIGYEPDWTVPYVVIETSGALSNKRFIPTWLIERIDWAQKEVHIRANRRQIFESPPVNAAALTDSNLLNQLAAYYSSPRQSRRPRPPVRTKLFKRIHPSPFRSR